VANKPIVSVVMPVLNPHPIYFRQAVESILNQTLDDWELVIMKHFFFKEAKTNDK